MTSPTRSWPQILQSRTLLPLEGLGIQVDGDQGVNVSNHPTDQGFPSINFSDGTSFTPLGRDHVGPTQSTTKQIADNITYTRGRHTIRAGVDIRWVRFAVPEIETPSDDYGLFTFNQGVFTGSSVGDLLIGAPNMTYLAVTGPSDNAGGVQTGIYGQDQWQINDRLTLSFGLRWELLSPFVDKNGIRANFDPNYTGTGANGQGAIIVNDILLNGLKPAPAFLASGKFSREGLRRLTRSPGVLFVDSWLHSTIHLDNCRHNDYC
jgi:outer membrane receptor protein involved in Fe transport